MSRATMKTKYKTIKGFDNQRKAELFAEGVKDSEVIQRNWHGKDKRRYYVRVVVRKGVKQ